jgi:SAM-dependent methyltransferase
MSNPSAQLPPSAAGVNHGQREYWDTDGAQLYNDHADTNEALIGPFGEAMLDAAALRPGERVLDVGCGHGASTLQAAERVAPSGRVVGVDISAAMLSAARGRVAESGWGSIDLLQADAQVHEFPAAWFDVVISRFGMMYFDDPPAAFRNLARALRPDGRLIFVCPQDPLKSEWVAVAFGAAIAVLGRTPEVGPASAPGTFALADPQRLTGQLASAGLRDVAQEPVTRPVRLGHNIGGVVDYILALPESRQLFAGASPQMLDAARTALAEAFAPYLGADGVVLGAAAWLVSAHR